MIHIPTFWNRESLDRKLYEFAKPPFQVTPCTLICTCRLLVKSKVFIVSRKGEKNERHDKHAENLQRLTILEMMLRRTPLKYDRHNGSQRPESANLRHAGFFVVLRAFLFFFFFCRTLLRSRTLLRLTLPIFCFFVVCVFEHSLFSLVVPVEHPDRHRCLAKESGSFSRVQND